MRLPVKRSVKMAGKSDGSAVNVFGIMGDDAATCGGEVRLCNSGGIVICCSVTV